MAKEFDIYLRNRLVECDLLVYSIPYRDGVSVNNRLILEAALNGCLLKKAVTANMGLEVGTHINQMIKLCLERLSVGIGLDAAAEIEKHAKLYLDNTPIIVETPIISTIERVFNEAKSNLILAAKPLIVQAAMSTGPVNLPLTVDTSMTDLSKRSLLNLHSSMLPSAKVIEVNQANYFHGSTSAIIHPALQSLCYQLACNASASVELMTLVLGTEIRHSLGRWYSGIAVDSKVTGTWGQKFIAVQPVATITQGIVEKLVKVLYPEESVTTIHTSSIELAKKRHRLLCEVDDGILSALDDRPLDDIDFVIL